MIKYIALAAIVAGLGGGFVWYTNMIGQHAADLQREVDQRAVLEQSLMDKQIEIERMEANAKEQKRQIRLRDKVYHELKAETDALEQQFAEVASDKQKECDALPVDDVIIDGLRARLATDRADPIATEDGDQERVPSPGFIPALRGRAFPGDD